MALRLQGESQRCCWRTGSRRAVTTGEPGVRQSVKSRRNLIVLIVIVGAIAAVWSWQHGGSDAGKSPAGGLPAAADGAGARAAVPDADGAGVVPVEAVPVQ